MKPVYFRFSTFQKEMAELRKHYFQLVFAKQGGVFYIRNVYPPRLHLKYLFKIEARTFHTAIIQWLQKPRSIVKKYILSFLV